MGTLGRASKRLLSPGGRFQEGRLRSCRASPQLVPSHGSSKVRRTAGRGRVLAQVSWGLRGRWHFGWGNPGPGPLLERRGAGTFQSPDLDPEPSALRACQLGWSPGGWTCGGLCLDWRRPSGRHLTWQVYSLRDSRRGRTREALEHRTE